MKRLLTLLTGISLSLVVNGQNNLVTKKQTFIHETSKEYEWPTDPSVLEKIEKWQDAKFGICSIGEYIQFPALQNHGHCVQKTDGLQIVAERHFREVPIVNLRNGIGDYPNPSSQAVLSQPNGRHL